MNSKQRKIAGKMREQAELDCSAQLQKLEYERCKFAEAREKGIKELEALSIQVTKDRADLSESIKAFKNTMIADKEDFVIRANLLREANVIREVILELELDAEPAEIALSIRKKFGILSRSGDMPRDCEDDLSVYDDYKKKRKVSKQRPISMAELVDTPLKADFETYEEFENLRNQVDDRINFLRMETHNLEYRLADLEERRDAMDQDQRELHEKDAQLARVYREQTDREAALTARSILLDNQHAALKAVTERLENANREPMAVISDVLLQLELEVDPIEIAKHIREIGKSLDVKW